MVSNEAIVILDAPPGTSCPVVTTIEGSDFCLLVTEPTPFGLHDLSLAVELVQKLEIPAGVVVNRADIGDDKVDAYCAKKGLPVLMRLPYDQEVAINYAQGVPAVGVLPKYQQKFSQLYQDINKQVR
jgi:MinD superfamily P-loop ATPase